MNYFERKELKTVADDATVAKASGLMYKMMCHIKKKKLLTKNFRQ